MITGLSSPAIMWHLLFYSAHKQLYELVADVMQSDTKLTNLVIINSRLPSVNCIFTPGLMFLQYFRYT